MKTQSRKSSEALLKANGQLRTKLKQARRRIRALRGTIAKQAGKIGWHKRQVKQDAAPLRATVTHLRQEVRNLKRQIMYRENRLLGLSPGVRGDGNSRAFTGAGTRHHHFRSREPEGVTG